MRPLAGGRFLDLPTAGLTQEALAHALDVSPSAIAAIEAGQTRGLPEASHSKLEEVLGRFLGTAP